LSQPTQQTKQEQQQPAQSQPVPSQLTEKQSQPNCEDRKENGGRQKPTTVQSARIAEIHVGEAVLVLDTRGDDCYHPALVIERPKVIKSPVGKKKKKKIKTAKQPPSSPGPSNLYSIQFWTGKQSNVNRSKICSKNDSDFFGVKVL
jgi:hypothetical protein